MESCKLTPRFGFGMKMSSPPGSDEPATLSEATSASRIDVKLGAWFACANELTPVKNDVPPGPAVNR